MRYIVVGGHIKRGVGSDAKIYAPGEVIELNPEDAKTLGASVEPVGKVNVTSETEVKPVEPSKPVSKKGDQ